MAKILLKNVTALPISLISPTGDVLMLQPLSNTLVDTLYAQTIQKGVVVVNPLVPPKPKITPGSLSSQLSAIDNPAVIAARTRSGG